VEAALLAQPGIRDAAVVGIPGERGTELVASVVLSPEFEADDQPDADDLPDTDEHLETENQPDADEQPNPDADPAVRLGARLDAYLESRLPVFKRPTSYRTVRMLPRTEVGRLDRTAVIADWTQYLGVEVNDRPGTRLSVVPGGSPPPVVEPVVEPVPRTEPPEVIEVSQLDTLGSRLPGISARSRRSAEDTDSDLFGEDWLEPADGDAVEPR
jgi:hypothetical protein